MALVTIDVHGQILQPGGLTPAVGTVRFRILSELRDLVDDIVYSPDSFTAILDVNGEFTLSDLPTTDNPDITPIDWIYEVWVNTDVWRELFYVQLPVAIGPVAEFSDLPNVDFDPCTGETTDPSEGGTIPHSHPYLPLTGGTITGDLIVLGVTTVDDLVVNEDLIVSGLTTVNDLVVTDDLTVTDDAAIGGDLDVNGVITGNFSNASNIDVMQLLAMGLSTAPISGGALTVNADPTKLDISAMTGYVVDYNSSAPLSPTNPALTFVNLAAQVGLTPAFAPASWWSVTPAGAVIQSNVAPSQTLRRQNILLGTTITLAGVITVVQTLPTIPSQVNNQFVDFMEALGSFCPNFTDNILSANGVNLMVNKTAGSIFARAFSQVPTYQNPHLATLAAQTPVSFRRVTRNPVFGANVTTMDVGNYDVAGVVTPIPNPGANSTNFRVWGFANSTVGDQILIQYGQAFFPNLTAAVAAIGGGNYVPNPASQFGALLGWISVRKDATNLSDPAQAVFTRAAKFATP